MVAATCHEATRGTAEEFVNFIESGLQRATFSAELLKWLCGQKQQREIKFFMDHISYLLHVTNTRFRPKIPAQQSLTFAKATLGDWQRCSALWSQVGAGYWTERQMWDRSRWIQHLSGAGATFWFALLQRHPVGFFELRPGRNGTKIEGIGLLPPWRGIGLGSELLSSATKKAFEAGVKRVWLHTATDDHPNALPNYLARGYSICRQTELLQPMSSEGIHTCN